MPVPWPYHVDPGTDIFGWSYALMPRLPGSSPIERSIEATLTPADRRAIVSALARTLAELHGVSWPHPGEYAPDTDTIEPLPAPFADWIEGQVWAKAQRAEMLGEALSHTDIAWLRSLLGEARDALAEPFVPGFTMHDYWLPNVLFDRRDGAWQVCGVFDFAEAYSGDGEADLARPMSVLLRRDEALAPIFLREYLGLRPPRPGFPQRFAIYLVDELLLGWAYHRSRGNLQRGMSLRELVESYTSALARSL